MGVFDPDRHENKLGINDLHKLNEREALGLLKAQEFILDLDIEYVFDSRLIMDVHTIAFGELYDWAGKWRSIETNIGIPVGRVPYAVSNTQIKSTF